MYHPGFAGTDADADTDTDTDADADADADADTGADTGTDTDAGTALGPKKRALDAPRGSAHIPAPSGKEIPIFQEN